MREQPVEHKGFTLVELLVVLAIIALLISILIPTLSSARTQSRFVVCQANLREIGALMQAYELEHDGEIPRGPFYNGAATGLPTFASDVATNQLWVGAGFFDGVREWPAQYIGLGLLRRIPGRKGNEFLFCPADDKLNIDEEARKIGLTGDDMYDYGLKAFGSYVYRQADALPDHLDGESIKLDALGTNTVTTVDQTPIKPVGTYQVKVAALALDVNTLGTGDCEQFNHGGRRVNVVYADGSVQGFDNEPQYTTLSARGPWASIAAGAFDPNCFPISPIIEGNLDRILIAADYGYVSAKPWEAPVPPLPVP